MKPFKVQHCQNAVRTFWSKVSSLGCTNRITAPGTGLAPSQPGRNRDQMTKSKILVTGATGELAARRRASFRDEGHEVRAFRPEGRRAADEWGGDGRQSPILIAFAPRWKALVLHILFTPSPVPTTPMHHRPATAAARRAVLITGILPNDLAILRAGCGFRSHYAR